MDPEGPRPRPGVRALCQGGRIDGERRARQSPRLQVGQVCRCVASACRLHPSSSACVLPLTSLLTLFSPASLAGDWAQGFHSWSSYFVGSAQSFNNVKPIEGQSPAIALSLLGLTGITAYCGLHFVGQVKKEHTVVISAAAGATGSVAVQLAKNVVGCKRVIGIAGGKEKCDFVKSLGADACLDYKSASFKADLAKATEGGVDVYFDNVGGEILNELLAKMNRFSRIIACGAISSASPPASRLGLKPPG